MAKQLRASQLRTRIMVLAEDQYSITNSHDGAPQLLITAAQGSDMLSGLQGHLNSCEHNHPLPAKHTIKKLKVKIK